MKNKSTAQIYWVVVKQRMERIGKDTLRSLYQYTHPLGSPSGGAVTEGDGEGIAALYTLSVLAALGHLSHRERQEVQFIIPLHLLTV